MSAKQQQVAAFTTTSQGIAKVLQNEVAVCASFDPAKVPQAQHPEYKRFQAVWDTGATGSVITERVVKECDLKQVGMTQVRGVNGTKRSAVYHVNIGLPNHVAVIGVPVTVGELVTQDVLIGMDIITKGDLAITNAGGQTVFSFRIPSMERIDYVQAGNARNPKKKASVTVGRNDPCPCGSGRKFKKCCGK